MSGRYPRYDPDEPEEDFDWTNWQQPITTIPLQQQSTEYAYAPFTTTALGPNVLSQPQTMYPYPPGYVPQGQLGPGGQAWPLGYTQSVQRPPTQQPWSPVIVPSNSTWPLPSTINAPAYTYVSRPGLPTTSPAPSSSYLVPESSASGRRPSRSRSLASDVSSTHSGSEPSPPGTPNAAEMSKYGFRKYDGTWTCAYPGCTSSTTFTRRCDIRKHYKRHTKTLFCRVEGCPQATEGGFSSRKDRARHEAKHNPNIACEWEGCGRVFSRVDNMKDHVRRVHRRKTTQ